VFLLVFLFCLFYYFFAVFNIVIHRVGLFFFFYSSKWRLSESFIAKSSLERAYLKGFEEMWHQILGSKWVYSVPLLCCGPAPTVALLFGGGIFSLICAVCIGLSLIDYLKHSRHEGNWNAWRRRLGVSMQLLSFGLTGLDWRYFLHDFSCPGEHKASHLLTRENWRRFLLSAVLWDVILTNLVSCFKKKNKSQKKNIHSFLILMWF